MIAKTWLASLLILAMACSAPGQALAADPSAAPPATWRSPESAARPADLSAGGGGPTAANASRAAAPSMSSAAGSIPSPAAAGLPRRPITRVSAGSGALPNDHGQIWREYDISPYTLRVSSTNHPEMAIVDWVLRETGYEAWHSEPLGILSPTQRVLRVYHTPEIQAVVGDIVDRFVASQADVHTFGIQVATVDSPNWRGRGPWNLRPVPVQTQGTQAWLLSKEDAALLIAELRRRSDYREHSSPHLLVNNGQSTVVSATRARSYVRGVKSRPEAWPGFEPETALIDEGFSLELSPLLSVDAQTIDATLKCNIDQVEKLVPVILDVPSPVAPRQRAKIEVPQMSHFRFHERFRWPVEQVLLIGMGVVALPIPVDGKPTVVGLPLPLPSSPARADMLVFVESKGKINQAPRVGRGGVPDAKTYQGRY